MYKEYMTAHISKSKASYIATLNFCFSSQFYSKLGWVTENGFWGIIILTKYQSNKVTLTTLST